jgi:hypothetical protein
MNSFVIPFQPIHLKLLELRQTEHDDIGTELLEAIVSMSSCWTFIVDDRIVLIYGFYILFDGVINVFIVPSVYLKNYPKTIVKRAREVLNDFPECIHRIQSVSPATPEADRWMLALGFVCEGTMVRYSSKGEDYRMWARIKR